MAKSKAKVQQGRKIYKKHLEAPAKAEYKENKSKWDKIAKDWCKKDHKNKKRKSKKTGNMYNFNVYMQFREMIGKKGGSPALAVILWKAHCGKYHADKDVKKPAPKKPKSAKQTKSTKQDKPASHKRMSADDVERQAKSYNRRKEKRGLASKLKKKFGESNAKRIVEKAKKLQK